MQLLPELNSGGVERGTLETGKHLVQKNHNSVVVSGGGRLVEQLEREGSLHIKIYWLQNAACSCAHMADAQVN